MKPFKPRGIFLQPIPEKWAGDMQAYTKYIAISLTLVGITFYVATCIINNIMTDFKLMQIARFEAKNLIDKDPFLKEEQNQGIAEALINI